MSAFALEDGVLYHTYSTYARGLDGLWGMYQWLDRGPQGAQRDGPLVAPPRRVQQGLSDFRGEIYERFLVRRNSETASFDCVSDGLRRRALAG